MQKNVKKNGCLYMNSEYTLFFMRVSKDGWREQVNIREYLFYNKLSVREFSKKVDCSRTYLSQIVHGKIKPGRKLARDIERATNGEVKAADMLGIDLRSSKNAGFESDSTEESSEEFKDLDDLKTTADILKEKKENL